MIRGSDFYAIWNEEAGLWSTDEDDVTQLIDKELDNYYVQHEHDYEGKVRVLHMWDAETGIIDSWHKYCQKQCRDNYHMLDEKLIFSNMPVDKKDYSSKRLDYPLEEGDISAYDKLMSVLYSPEERHKLDWAIGSIVTGDSKSLQKFMVLYGAAGTGKSTFLNIIQDLFAGYYSVFDAKALGSSNSSFALEAFRTNPLIGIQHDGDLSHIEDNTRLNSLVSHEQMIVNEKFKATYANQFKCFLFMGTNKPVKITDAKSGLIRRLIDVTPTGNKLSFKEYKKLMSQIKFELGPIAYYCQQLYLSNPNYYDDYVPTAMLGASNDFYNYVLDSYYIFKKEDSTTLKAAWEMYKIYCDEARVPYPLSQRVFKEELKNYFVDYKERQTTDDGNRLRSYYIGFKSEKFEDEIKEDKPEEKPTAELYSGPSLFDKECADFPAQYANKNETPTKAWANVKTTLKDLDTSRLHYVKVPENYIVIDFDIPGPDGEKCLEKNLEEAAKWPETYTELSKSGKGVHLHYIYTGDPEKLSRIYAEHIEVKVFTGNSSLRRKLTLCNNKPIATISSGLPLKGDKAVIEDKTIKNERHLRTLVIRNLNKEYMQFTKPSMDFIKTLTDQAYNSGIHYDISDLRGPIFNFAMSSTHQSDYCMDLVKQIHFKSEDPSENTEIVDDQPLIFFDIEVFPNLLLICWKKQGEKNPVNRLFNPTPKQIEPFFKMKMVGFNNRRYDNHIVYSAYLGYTNEQLYSLSQIIINSGKKGRSNCFFGEAYNFSYTDIYDFASAANKMSLKKLEIKMQIHHKELGMPWDQPVPKEKWELVAEYCDNDVLATEAAFDYLSADWTARQILSDIAGLTVNDTTNSLTTRIIFGKNKHPQDQFNYRDMGDVKQATDRFVVTKDNVIFNEFGDEFTVFDEQGRPIFPGYKFDPTKPGKEKSTYRGEPVGEGGYVYAEPGMYSDVALLDIASMHPSSIVAEDLFGKEYTHRFKEILDARIAIKHKDFDRAKTMLDGKLAKYLDDPKAAKTLAKALKTAINSVYGLTSAKFENPFRDPRNVDNIVAKRGALFMINLKHEVQQRGFTVVHIKTDSIKIANATPEIISFVMDYGHQYGYNFEHEATYDRICLVNDAVYIAKFATLEKCYELYSKEYVDADPSNCEENKETGGMWTATGTQFAVPYVFKTLFSHEDLDFSDFCEIKEVTGALYLDMDEGLSEGEHSYHFVGKIGEFCPIKPCCGGGRLCREAVDAKTGEKKYDAAVGTKGYRWLESETVRNLAKQDDIDENYYIHLADDAVDTIKQYGDYEWFVSD